ncbi:MAG: RNA methyltransferase [Bacteroidales bacterium]|nr:RNA methyltransferase [Bacteroidales bacterium]MBR6929969.1 RNA methyltransferase [Bacteroidales bacterium]
MKKSIVYDGKVTQDVELQQNAARDAAMLDFLTQFITDERRQRFEEVLDFRTRHITVVLEDIFQPHNASAVLRSCDLRGIQDIHIVENNYAYDVNPDVVLGSTKWLNLYYYNKENEFNTPAAFERLHEKGYRIVATCPHRDDFTPDTLPLDQPIALVFGTEKLGLSEYAVENADMHVRIPMYGFTESYNISVSAALLLYTLTNRLHASTDIDWHLTKEERDALRLVWTRRTLNRIRQYDRKFFELHPEFA